jgi:hypothetical protein
MVSEKITEVETPDSYVAPTNCNCWEPWHSIIGRTCPVHGYVRPASITWTQPSTYTVRGGGFIDTAGKTYVTHNSNKITLNEGGRIENASIPYGALVAKGNHTIIRNNTFTSPMEESE